MTLEEYYGNKFPLLKQGETYLKTLMETYPNSCNKDGMQAILYIKTRIKTPKSMIEKLKRHGMKEDSQTALQHIHDALGVRVICSFVEDVYQIAKWLQKSGEIQIMEKKDYIAYPKPNGAFI